MFIPKSFSSSQSTKEVLFDEVLEEEKGVVKQSSLLILTIKSLLSFEQYSTNDFQSSFSHGKIVPCMRVLRRPDFFFFEQFGDSIKVREGMVWSSFERSERSFRSTSTEEWVFLTFFLLNMEWRVRTDQKENETMKKTKHIYRPYVLFLLRQRFEPYWLNMFTFWDFVM